MSLLDDLVDKVSLLNEAERVEYNRRLQTAKATKELSAQLAAELKTLDKSIDLFSLISMTTRTMFLGFFAAIFFLAISTDGRFIWLGSILAVAVVVVLVDNKKQAYVSQRTSLLQQQAMAGRDWSAIGLEVSFLHAILEMEAAMQVKDASFQNLQNISSSQAERKRTLSHYDYQIRNEILVNIQNEKNWWSKIDVLTNRWYSVK